MVRRIAIVAALALAVAPGCARAGDTPPRATTVLSHRPIVVVGTNESANWGGYNQGTIEKGGKVFSSVSGTWNVPTATPHKNGEAEYSSTWIGIGGGCVDASCNVGDSTLIQAGTEQDVTKSGTAVYSAWYELIPAPSITIPSVPVKAGDKITATISELAPGSEVWTITLKNVTTGKSFSTTVPYSSTHATAEWIEETPVVVSSNGGVTIGPLPKLSKVTFDKATVNGANAGLVAAEEIRLVDLKGAVLVTPSAPDPQKDGFNVCTYSTTCAAPTKLPGRA